MKTYQFKILKVKFDLMFGFVGFGFTKYSFMKTSMTFLWDWNIRFGIIGLIKWQSKSFEELKKMSDIAWDEKWKRAGYAANPKLEKGVKV